MCHAHPDGQTMVNGYTPTMKMIPTATSTTRRGVNLLSVSTRVPPFLFKRQIRSGSIKAQDTRFAQRQNGDSAVARTDSSSLVPDQSGPSDIFVLGPTQVNYAYR